MNSGSPGNAVMQVGNEEPTRSLPQEQQTDIGKELVHVARDRYWTWLMGMAISFIPVVALPLYLCFTSSINSIPTFLSKVFYQSDILYLVISLSISAHNDASANMPKSFLNWWQKINWILIVLGAVIFGILTIVENTSGTIASSSVLWFNSIFFVISIIIGSVPYVSSIVEAKKVAKGGV